MSNTEWTEGDSALYRQLAQIAVPARAEQLASLLTLIPFAQDEPFRVVELASGEGYLAAAILDAFPQAQVLALDYEASMREATRQRLSAYPERWQVKPFDISQTEWFPQMANADLVISSLCVHHLDATGKQRLFRGIAEQLSARGALLIADLVLPQNGRARELFAATWDSMAEMAAISRDMSRDLFEKFVETQWNYYRYPDDFDQPSPLFDQLNWLSAAGFRTVDCFWMQAGHAIYGGYRMDAVQGLRFEDALQHAQRVLTA